MTKLERPTWSVIWRSPALLSWRWLAVALGYRRSIPVVVTAAPGTHPRLRERSLRRACFWALLIAVLSAALGGAWSAAAKPSSDVPDDAKVEEGTITGDIVTATKRAVSVEYARTGTASEEMLLPLDDTIKVEGPKTLAQLKPGDRVSVQYRQTYRDGKDGKRTILKTVAVKIVLLRSALPEGSLRTEEAVATP